MQMVIMFILFWTVKGLVQSIWFGFLLQSTLIISNSKGLSETLRDICTSKYQSWESEENNKLNDHI